MSLVPNLQLPALSAGEGNLNERFDLFNLPTAQAHRAGSGHDAVEARAKKRRRRPPQRRAPGVVGAVFRQGYARTLRVTLPAAEGCSGRAQRRRTGSSAERSDTRRQGGDPRRTISGEGPWRAARVRRRRRAARGAARRVALATPERHASPTTPGARLSMAAAALLCPRFPDHECRCLPGVPETFDSALLFVGACSSLLAAANRRGIFPAQGCRREQRRVL